jgi:hypothetical protein
VVFESWEEFCGFFCPEKPERLNTLIAALEVLEAKGDGRDFSAGQAARIVAAAERTTGEVLPSHRPAAESRQVSDLSQPARAAEAGVSERTQRKLDALAHRRPDLLDEVKAGRRSAHAASLEAGIVKLPDPYKQLCRWWAAASEEQRAAFEDYIAMWRRRRAAPP